MTQCKRYDLGNWFPKSSISISKNVFFLKIVVSLRIKVIKNIRRFKYIHINDILITKYINQKIQHIIIIRFKNLFSPHID